MNTLYRGIVRLSLLSVVCCAALAQTEVLKQVRLPKPQTDGGKPLMQALSERKSTRTFGSRTIPEQVLSNLLWAADGINRSPHGSHGDEPAGD